MGGLESNTGGDIRLTERQQQCLSLVAEGLSTKQIARTLRLSPSTVDNHLQTAIARLGAQGRVEAARLHMTITPKDLNGATRVTNQKTMASESAPWNKRLFNLPPLGGRVVYEDVAARVRRIVQISLLTLMVSLTLILTISGIVLLLEPAHWRDAVPTRQ